MRGNSSSSNKAAGGPLQKPMAVAADTALGKTAPANNKPLEEGDSNADEDEEVYEPEFEEDDDEDEDDEVDRLLSDRAAKSLKDKNINKAGKPEEVKEMKSVDEETDQGKAVMVGNDDGDDVAGVSSSDSDGEYSDDLKQLDKRSSEVQVAATVAAAATSAAIVNKKPATDKEAEVSSSADEDLE